MLNDLDNEEVLKVLKTKSILHDHLSTSEIDRFAQNLSIQSFREGEHLLKEGAPATSLMVLIAGEARIAVNGQQVAVLHAGDLMGEAMFSEEGIRTASAIASTDGVRAIFTLEKYEELFRTAPDIALKCKHLFEELYRSRQDRNIEFFSIDTTKYLALIAHNEMKSNLVAFVKRYKSLIEKFPLVATGTTGQLLYKEAGILLSRKVKSGPLGGDQAIGAMIASENILGILFFRDPLSAHPHHADIEALGRLCDVYQVPFATNASTAQAVLNHLMSRMVYVKDYRTDADFDSSVLKKYHAQQSRVVDSGQETPETLPTNERQMKENTR